MSDDERLIYVEENICWIKEKEEIKLTYKGIKRRKFIIGIEPDPYSGSIDKRGWRCQNLCSRCYYNHDRCLSRIGGGFQKIVGLCRYSPIIRNFLEEHGIDFRYIKYFKKRF